MSVGIVSEPLDIEKETATGLFLLSGTQYPIMTYWGIICNLTIHIACKGL